jgi:preprotein translocase subunit YajC
MPAALIATANEAPAAQPANYGLFIILALVLGAMWFMSRRSRKQQQQSMEFRSNLKPGDEVMTGSGLFGTVVEVDGDAVTLETTPGGAHTVWLRAAIAKVASPPYAGVSDVDEDAEDADDEDDEEYEDYDEDDDLGEDIEVPDDLSSLDEDKADGAEGNEKDKNKD